MDYEFDLLLNEELSRRHARPDGWRCFTFYEPVFKHTPYYRVLKFAGHYDVQCRLSRRFIESLNIKRLPVDSGPGFLSIMFREPKLWTHPEPSMLPLMRFRRFRGMCTRAPILRKEELVFEFLNSDRRTATRDLLYVSFNREMLVRLGFGANIDGSNREPSHRSATARR